MKENNIQTVYTDGIGKIHFFGNMIRLDMMNFVPTESNEEKPEPETVMRLVMSPNAFLASYESFVNMVAKLEKAGIISVANDKEEKKEDNAEAVEEPVVAPAEEVKPEA